MTILNSFFLWSICLFSWLSIGIFDSSFRSKMQILFLFYWLKVQLLLPKTVCSACKILIFIGINISQHQNIFSKAFIVTNSYFVAYFLITDSFIVDSWFHKGIHRYPPLISSLLVLRLVVASIVISMIFFIFSHSFIFSLCPLIFIIRTSRIFSFSANKVVLSA